MKKLGGLLLMAMLFIACTEESETTKQYLFNELHKEETGLNFINQVEDTPEHSIINYIYFYNGAGVAVGDINNDGATDVNDLLLLLSVFGDEC